MSRNKMEAVLYDIQLAQAVFHIKYNNFITHEQREALLNGVLEKHGITKEVLDSSLVWYSDHIETYMKINDSVLSHLNVELAGYKQLVAELEKKDVEIDMDFPSYILLTPDQPFFSFNLDSLKLGENMISANSRISFSVLGNSSKVNLLYSSLFQYSDTSIVKSDIVTTFSDTITSPSFSDEKLKRFSGYIYVDSELPRFEVLIYNIKVSVKNDTLMNVTGNGMPHTIVSPQNVSGPPPVVLERHELKLSEEKVEFKEFQMKESETK